MLFLLALAIILLLFAGPFAYNSMGAKRKRIEQYEKRTGEKLSAKEKIRALRKR